MSDDTVSRETKTATFSRKMLWKAHDGCTANYPSVRRSRKCGCFYCCQIFDASEVNEDECIDDEEGETAVCPRCGIDSVLADAAGYPMTKAFLQAMHDVWF